jgi:hypothetical protein
VCSVDVVAAWRVASASSAFGSVSVVFWENFLEGEGGRRSTLWWEEARLVPAQMHAHVMKAALKKL